MEFEQPHITKLIERCKSADKNAQKQIYTMYYLAMYNSAYRILKDSFEAEDIMQEAFLTAFTKLHTFKSEVTFGAWLKKIVINKSLTQLKKNDKYQEVKMEVVSNTELDDTASTVNYTDLNAKKIVNSIKKLNENYQLVLTLHLIEGYDYEEIAEIMNYSNQNVRTIVSRAKNKLKELLVEDTKKSNFYGG